MINLIQMQILLVEEELIYDKLISEYETINSELKHNNQLRAQGLVHIMRL